MHRHVCAVERATHVRLGSGKSMHIKFVYGVSVVVC